MAHRDPLTRAADNALADIRTVARLWDDYHHHLSSRDFHCQRAEGKEPMRSRVVDDSYALYTRMAVDAAKGIERILRRYNPEAQQREAQALIDNSVPGKLGMNYPGPDEE